MQIKKYHVENVLRKYIPNIAQVNMILNEIFPRKKRRSSKLKDGQESIKYLTKKADALFSKYIRKIDNYTCCTCGKYLKDMDGNDNSQCGHYIERDNWNLRFDEINANCQCGFCNIQHQQDKTIYRKFMINKYGEEKVLKLENTPKDFLGSINIRSKRQLLERVIEKYEAE